jgi:hypothetical protein
MTDITGVIAIDGDGHEWLQRLLAATEREIADFRREDWHDHRALLGSLNELCEHLRSELREASRDARPPLS